MFSLLSDENVEVLSIEEIYRRRALESLMKAKGKVLFLHALEINSLEGFYFLQVCCCNAIHPCEKTWLNTMDSRPSFYVFFSLSTMDNLL